MGTGRYKNGKFDITVVADYMLTAAEWTEWEAAFNKANELLYKATDGQCQFGKLFLCDDSVGIGTADMKLVDTGGVSMADTGGWGLDGWYVYLEKYVKETPLSLLHEWGHYVWGLKDEYESGPIYHDIDDSSAAPDNHTIPIDPSGLANNELVVPETHAYLYFGGVREKRKVSGNTGTTITVNNDFSDLPTNADSMEVKLIREAECGSDVAGSNYCLMERSRDAAGEFVGGVWTDAANPVTEFCSTSNHDPDTDTEQEWKHGESCWGTIVSHADFAGLTKPDPGAAGPTTGWTDPDWYILDKEPRFAVVLDHSGSMSQGHKMADAQHGATYWLEKTKVNGGQLAIAAYNHGVSSVLDLTDVSTIADLNPLIGDINGIQPQGSTNIRDALYEALGQIEGPGTRAAVQVALLLTDGKHNTPSGSSAAEVIPDFQEAGVRIYTLGVGEPDKVDMPVLDELADETHGTSYAVGDDNPGDIETAMVEIDNEVRGGIITTEPIIFPDTDASPFQELVKKVSARGKRPPLEDLLRAARVKSWRELLEPMGKRPPVAHGVRVPVEGKMDRVSFTLVYPESTEVWLYLIAPDGTPFDTSSTTAHHVVSPAPHEFCLVDDPKPGLWTLLAVRPGSGAGFRCHAVAGAQNRRLSATGGARSHNAEGSLVPLWASASWRHPLSNLKVMATITDPKGGRTRVRLTDDDSETRGNGKYQGYVRPRLPGRYHGVIDIRCDGRAHIAGPHDVLSVPGSKLDRFDPRFDCPRFRRVVRFSFDVGKRPQVKDEEKLDGSVDRFGLIRKRPAKLISARDDLRQETKMKGR